MDPWSKLLAILPPRRLRRVVFPLPEGPIRARSSPGLAEPVIPVMISFSVVVATPLRITLYLSSVNCKINGEKWGKKYSLVATDQT